MINSQDIKKGTAIRMDGAIWVCIDFQHRKPGKGNTIMNIKMKNVTDGRVLERRYNIGEKSRTWSSSTATTSTCTKTRKAASS